MHRFCTILIAVLLVVALSIPVFAADFNGRELPDLPTPTDETLVNSFIHEYASTYTLYFTDFDTVVKGDFLKTKAAGKYESYTIVDGAWQFKSSNNVPADNMIAQISGTSFPVIWSTSDIYYSDGSLYLSGSAPSFCDGSSCPATDADHDNICDDCGNVLAYNLRSTVLDYAKSRAETYTDYPYYAVVEHMTFEGSLLVYLSKTPMYAEAPRYDTVNGTSLSWFQVNTNEDGTFTHTVRNYTDPWTGTLVYSNHDIENFLEPPLAVVIQGVTGEALEVEIPSLMAEMKIIVISAVGCLALLIALPLLSKKLRTYLKG